MDPKVDFIPKSLGLKLWPGCWWSGCSVATVGAMVSNRRSNLTCFCLFWGFFWWNTPTYFPPRLGPSHSPREVLSESSSFYWVPGKTTSAEAARCHCHSGRKAGTRDTFLHRQSNLEKEGKKKLVHVWNDAQHFRSVLVSKTITNIEMNL